MNRTCHVWIVGVSLLTMVCWLGAASAVRAEILFQDLFNDADRDNDGTTDDGNASPVGTPDGIKWLAIGGQTSGGNIRPAFTIVNDDVTGGIGTGNALNIASLGANNEFIGVFPSSITLGATIGSQLKISFDIRVIPTNSEFPANLQSFRFGIYEDSDNQFGTPSVNADGVSPTVWGVTDGWFDGANTLPDPPFPIGPGTINDYGVHARVKLGTSTPTDGDWRILEELNTAGQILGGTGDTDEVARPADFNAMASRQIDSTAPRHITLTLSRVEDNGTGNTIRHDLDIDGLGFGGHDLNGTGTVNFDSRDTFHYFVGSMTFSIANYLIDNFKVESIIGEDQGQPGDFDGDGDVDGRDFLIWQRGGTTPALDPGLLNDWQTHYGVGTLSAVMGTVPEPSALCLALCAMLVTGTRRTR